jgi:hypothetical protein
VANIGEVGGQMTKKTCVVLAAIALGCSVESEDGLELEALEHDDSALEIIENLRQAGYPEPEIDVREDGIVVVGGDAEVSLEASREMIGVATRGGERWEPEGDEFRQYRTNNTVNPAFDVICIDGSAYTGTLSTALNNAIARYTNLNLSFNLVRTSGSNAGCDAEIIAAVVGGGGGSAGFPSGGFPYGQINIGNAVAGYGVNVATHVITHELGHCVGFRHSDYYNRSISCGGGAYNEGNGGVGAVLIPGTPANATFNGSVMNSCFHGGSTGQWTATDLTALNALYPGGGGGGGGGAPDPNSCEDSNACGAQAPGGCWCDNSCINYGDCCSDGPC